MSNLVKHAQYELERAGLFDEDSDYEGMLGRASLALVEEFSKQRHSGHSAFMVMDIVSRLVAYEPLGPLTDAPDEWFFHGEGMFESGAGLWQNKRNGKAFSHDGGKTYYLIDDKDVVYTSEVANV